MMEKILNEARAAELWEQIGRRLDGKQDKLAGQTGQAVGFDSAGNAAAVQGWSNPNLLDNWYFGDPINQRGQLEYTGAGYKFDRWCNGHDTMVTKIEPGYVSCTALAESGVNLQQAVECVPAGNTICLSALCAGNVNLVIGYLQGGEYKFPAADHMRQEEAGILTIICDIPNDATSLTAFLQTDSGTARYYAVKLELGRHQTLARKDADGNWVLNDPPPDKALELAKCQRYLVRYGEYDTFEFVNSTDEYADYRVNLPCALRTTPTIISDHLPSEVTVAWYNPYSNQVRLRLPAAGADLKRLELSGAVYFSAEL